MILSVNDLYQNLDLLQLRINQHYEAAKCDKSNCQDFNFDIFFLNHVNDLINDYLRCKVDYSGRPREIE